jgi:hypothetical protein
VNNFRALSGDRGMGPFTEGWTLADADAVVERNLPEELLYVPIVVSMNAAVLNRQWAEDVCFKLTDHPHAAVRGNAILGLGHIARTCGALDLERAIPVIRKALADDHADVRAHAEDVVGDLEIFLDIIFPQ